MISRRAAYTDIIILILWLRVYYTYRVCVCLRGKFVYFTNGYSSNNNIIRRFSRDILDHATDFIWNVYRLMPRDAYSHVFSAAADDDGPLGGEPT